MIFRDLPIYSLRLYQGGINDCCEPSLGACTGDGNFDGDGNCFALVFEVVILGMIGSAAARHAAKISDQRIVLIGPSEESSTNHDADSRDDASPQQSTRRDEQGTVIGVVGIRQDITLHA